MFRSNALQRWNRICVSSTIYIYLGRVNVRQDLNVLSMSRTIDYIYSTYTYSAAVIFLLVCRDFNVRNFFKIIIVLINPKILFSFFFFFIFNSWTQYMQYLINISPIEVRNRRWQNICLWHCLLIRSRETLFCWVE